MLPILATMWMNFRNSMFSKSKGYILFDSFYIHINSATAKSLQWCPTV